jgi:hypothetical protein
LPGDPIRDRRTGVSDVRIRLQPPGYAAGFAAYIALDSVQSRFYATSSDLYEVCLVVSRALHLRYDCAGNFPTVILHPLVTPLVPDLEPLEPMTAFLVTPSEVPVHIRRIDGAHGTSFAIDELDNPSSATLGLGLRPAPHILTPGYVGTTAKQGAGTKIVRRYQKELARQFVRIRSYWVGPQALAMLKSGARLTLSEQTPPEFDLLREEPDV